MELTESRIQTVAGFLKGKRREKFLASIEILKASLQQGGWVTRGSVKSQSGFYQGITKQASDAGDFNLYMCFLYGSTYHGKADRVMMRKTADIPLEVSVAWVGLCLENEAARKELDAARPAPVITAVGLSPKVTKTLIESNLDIDLPSIKMAEVAYFEIPALNDDNTAKIGRDGMPLMERIYYVKWSQGVLFGQSRFSNGGCEACGKAIPSGLFVPIEARCKRLGKTVALWVGCDCARNIFGVKDIGLDKNAKAPQGA